MAFGTNDKLNFCLMTTANYITKALVMYDSLMKECKNDFNFFYYAFDQLTYDYLKKLNYKNIIPIPLHDLENFYPELVKTKKTRSTAEYFFTCTPHIMDYALKNYDIDHITYVDADLFFYNDPIAILKEVKNDSVLITEHRYFPDNNDSVSGKYCVQFIPIMNDESGNKVIDWYKEKCIEWCYLKAEDGKWADQGYLNHWPEIFDNIVVMENRGGGVARWNSDAYSFVKENDNLKAFNSEINKDVDIIFYHFEGLKIYANKLMTVGLLKNEEALFKSIYYDYIVKLSSKENELIDKLEISRSKFNYQKYQYSFFRVFLSTIRRFFLPKKNKTDMIYYYKYLKNYKWLP